MEKTTLTPSYARVRGTHHYVWRRLQMGEGKVAIPYMGIADRPTDLHGDARGRYVTSDNEV